MAQLIMPPIIRAGEATQEGIQGLGNAMALRSNLDTQKLQQNRMLMQNQQMQQDLAKRAELEALLRTSANPERDGYEWAKRNDPDLAGKIGAQYLNRFLQKAKVDPQGAASELENSTGEKIQVGKRFAKLPFEGGSEKVVDLLTGEEKVINDARAIAEVRADLARDIEGMRLQGREDIERLKADLKTDTSMTGPEMYMKDPGAYEGMREAEQRARAKYRAPARAGAGRGSASTDLQERKLRQTIKTKKERKLADLEREFKYSNSPGGLGKVNPMTSEELTQRKNQIQREFEEDLQAAGFEATPYNYPEEAAQATPTAPSGREVTATGPGGKKIKLVNGQWVPFN